MNFWRRLKYLLPSYRRAQEDDVREELASLAEMTEPAALGNLTRAAEEARAAWGWSHLEQLYRDLQYAARMLRHSPGFTVTAVFSLLSASGPTRRFSASSMRLCSGGSRCPIPKGWSSYICRRQARKVPSTASPIRSSIRWQNSMRSLRAWLASAVGASTSDLRGAISRVPGAMVSGAYYGTLGLNPVVGRLFTPEDDLPGATLVAVITYGYWERQFAHHPGIVGQSVRINGVPVTIVGVSPPGFVGANVGSIADITMPIQAMPRVNPQSAALLGAGNFWLRGLARLKRAFPFPKQRPDWSPFGRNYQNKSSVRIGPALAGSS